MIMSTAEDLLKINKDFTIQADKLDSKTFELTCRHRRMKDVVRNYYVSKTEYDIYKDLKLTKEVIEAL